MFVTIDSLFCAREVQMFFRSARQITADIVQRRWEKIWTDLQTVPPLKRHGRRQGYLLHWEHSQLPCLSLLTAWQMYLRTYDIRTQIPVRSDLEIADGSEGSKYLDQLTGGGLPCNLRNRLANPIDSALQWQIYNFVSACSPMMGDVTPAHICFTA